MDISVAEIMRGFARRTGLENGDRWARRYLWTDAFAVLNWLGRYVEEGDSESLRLALRLVDQTHRVLGRHRPDDAHTGWISGLDEEKGANHPTLGGLRIGKERPERRSDEAFDSDLEWERDGQYFHYLTKWMHALDAVSRVTGDPTPRRWAIELARGAHAAFAISPAAGAPIGFYWKMSIDWSRPLVPSMGQQDPLDAWITYNRLQGGPGAAPEFDLHREIHDAAAICAGRNWSTDDALGIGGLLSDASALARMTAEGVVREPTLLAGLVEAAAAGIAALRRSRGFEAPAEQRLAFRELGLAIGLQAVPLLRSCILGAPGVFSNRDTLLSTLGVLSRYERLAAQINGFWLDDAHRSVSTWTDHREINEVMLATSLAPYGYLQI